MSRDPSTADSEPTPRIPLTTRISAARALLEDGMGDEYPFLSGRQQARIQEAITFLQEAEDGFRGGVRE
ncbi:hypothetical protein [Halorarius litoreus]|uniref:hypothetical protein n=1 Tax=Halorarius litoreus TaxID=2962676 RepID=UPI0020CDCF35|nr:hypothetical protein [Halorarius litoreus]